MRRLPLAQSLGQLLPAFLVALALTWAPRAQAAASPGEEQHRLAEALAARGVDDESPPIQTFWEAWAIIREYYLDQAVVWPERLISGAIAGLGRSAADPEAPPILLDASGQLSGADTRTLVYAAVRGMVRSLGDPNSVFLTPDERRVAISRFSGNLEGIGACLDLRAGQLTVSGLVEGSPADQIGLRPGDVILAVDGRPTAGRPMQDLVLALRGAAGTSVSVTMRPVDGLTAFERTIVRAEIRLISARGRMVEPGIGLLRLIAFTESTDAESGALLEDLRQQGAQALLLDLRGNLGGLLEPAVAVAARFVASSPIVWQEDAHGGRYGYERPAEQPMVEWPLVVLADRWTASASEVVALVLRDAGRARLVGQPTYGKGTVQYLFELSDGSGLHLTAARWLSPAGTRVGPSGLSPDVWVSGFGGDGTDPVAEEGLRLLRPLVGPAATGPFWLTDPTLDDCSPNSANAA